MLSKTMSKWDSKECLNKHQEGKKKKTKEMKNRIENNK
jgi:hypothetical protein